MKLVYLYFVALICLVSKCTGSGDSTPAASSATTGEVKTEEINLVDVISQPSLEDILEGVSTSKMALYSVWSNGEKKLITDSFDVKISNPEMLEFKNGIFSALGAGETKITFKYKDKEFVKILKILAAKIKSISVLPDVPAPNAFSTVQFSVKAQLENDKEIDATSLVKFSSKKTFGCFATEGKPVYSGGVATNCDSSPVANASKTTFYAIKEGCETITASVSFLGKDYSKDTEFCIRKAQPRSAAFITHNFWLVHGSAETRTPNEVANAVGTSVPVNWPITIGANFTFTNNSVSSADRESIYLKSNEFATLENHPTLSDSKILTVISPDKSIQLCIKLSDENEFCKSLTSFEYSLASDSLYTQLDNSKVLLSSDSTVKNLSLNVPSYPYELDIPLMATVQNSPPGTLDYTGRIEAGSMGLWESADTAVVQIENQVANRRQKVKFLSDGRALIKFKIKKSPSSNEMIVVDAGYISVTKKKPTYVTVGVVNKYLDDNTSVEPLNRAVVLGTNKLVRSKVFAYYSDSSMEEVTDRANCQIRNVAGKPVVGTMYNEFVFQDTKYNCVLFVPGSTDERSGVVEAVYGGVKGEGYNVTSGPADYFAIQDITFNKPYPLGKNSVVTFTPKIKNSFNAQISGPKLTSSFVSNITDTTFETQTIGQGTITYSLKYYAFGWERDATFTKTIEVEKKAIQSDLKITAGALPSANWVGTQSRTFSASAIESDGERRDVTPDVTWSTSCAPYIIQDSSNPNVFTANLEKDECTVEAKYTLPDSTVLSAISDKYKIYSKPVSKHVAFVSSELFTLYGQPITTAFADASCERLARTAHMGSYNGWTALVNGPRSRVTFSEKIVDVNGSTLVNDPTKFWYNASSPVNGPNIYLTEQGTSIGSFRLVWTFSDKDGYARAATQICRDTDGFTGATGEAGTVVNGQWMGGGAWGCNGGAARLYCVSK